MLNSDDGKKERPTTLKPEMNFSGEGAPQRIKRSRTFSPGKRSPSLLPQLMKVQSLRKFLFSGNATFSKLFFVPAIQ